MLRYSHPWGIPRENRLIARTWGRLTLLLAAICGLANPQGAQAGVLPEGGKSSVGFDTTGYLGALQADRESVFSSLQLQWQGSDHGRVVEAAAQAELMLTLNRTSYHFVEFPEAYVGTSAELSHTQISLGRKLESWSHLDEKWSLGIWQPRFRWDYLHPDTVGLTGAFLTVNEPLFQLTAFASPGFIPERGAPQDLNDGKFSSESPWFLSPGTRMSIFDQDTAIRYHLNIPPIRQLLAHPGGSVMARVGRPTGAWGSAAYGFKPVNQLLISYDGYLNLNSLDAQVELYPRVDYHHVGSLEAGFAGQGLGGWISLLAERPVENTDAAYAGLTSQKLSPSLAVSTAVDVDLAGRGTQATHLGVGYLRQWGGNAGDLGPLATPGVSRFEPRYPFQNSVSVDLGSPLPGPWKGRLSGASRVIYDIANDGMIFSSEVKYHPGAAWVVGVGADLLSSGASDSSTDFVSRYRANDRVHGGVTYVF